MNKIDKSNFNRLVGVWQTKGEIKSGNGELNGIDSYELILDGNYILHKANVEMGDEKSETLEIIQLDNSPDKAKMHYFNTKGEEGTMTSSLINNDFSIEGKDLKFAGTINDENTIIKGKWYTKSEDGNWTESIDLNLQKQIQ